MNIRIRQIYYSDKQRGRLLKQAEPYCNTHANHFMENQVLADCYRSKDYRGCNYYGVFSWRFFKKTKMNFEALDSTIARDPQRAHVYGFCLEHPPHVNVWRYALDRGWHPTSIIDIGQKILDRLGFREDILTLSTPAVYSNYWLATPEIFKRYLEEMLLPAMDLMENDEEIMGLCYEDSKYQLPSGRTMLTPEQLLKIFNRPYYTLHSFVCERLFSTWLALNPAISFKHIKKANPDFGSINYLTTIHRMVKKLVGASC